MRSSDSDLPVLYSQKEIMEKLRIKRHSFENLVKQGLARTKIGRNIFYEIDDVNRALAELKESCQKQSITITGHQNATQRSRRTGIRTSLSTVSALERAVEQTITRKPKHSH